MPIHQTISLSKSPADVFATLTSGEAFAAMSGEAATIDATAGGAFSLFGGKIEGRTIELVEGARLVQAWRPANWPAGHYSVVRFELSADGEGTKVELTHDAFPPEAAEHLDAGWHRNYWEPMAA